MTNIRKLKLKKFTIKVYKKKQSNFINLFKKTLLILLAFKNLVRNAIFLFLLMITLVISRFL